MRWERGRDRAVLCAAVSLALAAAVGPARGADTAGAVTAGAVDPAAAVGPAAIQVPAARAAEALDQSVPVAAVQRLLYARPFRLREPYVYSYLAAQPAITQGLLLVIEVDPEIAKPSQVDVPVLYAGDTPAHLTNTGYPSGRMVVIAPDWFDPARAPVFFGSMELPERVDRARGRQEQVLAVGRGAGPFPAVERAAAFAAGGELLECRGSVELFLAVADLIDRYAPSEAELADLYRVPLVEP